MNDTYVYVLAFNIYFHYTVENAKSKHLMLYGHQGRVEVGMTFPNEQCKIKMAWNLIVCILLYSPSSVNSVNASVFVVNLVEDGRWGREEHIVLPDGRNAALAYGKNCGQYSLQDMALGQHYVWDI